MPYKVQIMGVETFKWQNKAKVFNLLKKNKVKGAVLISGDVHFA